MSPLLRCQAVLSDLDGVLIDSTTAIRLSWCEWADRHGLDHDLVLRGLHGHRAQDTIRRVAPHLDPDEETRQMVAIELSHIASDFAYPGAGAFLHALAGYPHAVVTSGLCELASARLRQGKLPIPRVFITADDVSAGKPDPEGYLLAARRLGVEPAHCVVIEDSAAGLQAAHAAGMRAAAVLTTHDRSELGLADLILPALTDLALSFEDRTILLAAAG